MGSKGISKGSSRPREGGSVPQNLPDKWVLVDDLSPGTAGIKAKLNMLGDMNPARVVHIKPYLGGANDTALTGIVSEIQDRLQ